MNLHIKHLQKMITNVVKTETLEYILLIYLIILFFLTNMYIYIYIYKTHIYVTRLLNSNKK